MAGGDKRIRIEDDGVDRISELPVDLREHILEFLSFKDAVVTSVLSSKWRYCWTGLRKLNFNKGFLNTKTGAWWPHIRVIDRVLMLHSGHIREFILFVPHTFHEPIDINAWLRVLSNNGVQKIYIDASRHSARSLRIPSCLFRCQELKELSLCYCKLIFPSDFEGFANLISLSLHSVDIDPSLLESLLSGSPLLERLFLKNLEFDKPFALEALNLKNFYFGDYWFPNITLKEVPKLTCIALLATDRGVKINTPQPYNTLDLFCSLSNMEELTYDLLLLEPLSESCPSIAPTPLVNLKSLTIRSLDPSFSRDVLFTLALIKSAPNLQHLTVYLDPQFVCGFHAEKKKGQAVRLLESEATKNGSCNSLHTTKIRGVEMPRHEILLLELFQKCCQKLKSIVIK